MDPGDRDPDRDGDFEAFVAARGPRLLRVACGRGVLVSLDLRKFAGLHTKVRDPAGLYALDEPSPLCHKLMGTEEYGALLAGPDPGADVGIQVSVCVAGTGAGSRSSTTYAP